MLSKTEPWKRTGSWGNKRAIITNSELGAYLLDEPDILTKPVEVQLLDGPAVKFDGARRGLVPALDETDNGTFSGATLALIKCQFDSPTRYYGYIPLRR